MLLCVRSPPLSTPGKADAEAFARRDSVSSDLLLRILLDVGVAEVRPAFRSPFSESLADRQRFLADEELCNYKRSCNTNADMDILSNSLCASPAARFQTASESACKSARSDRFLPSVAPKNAPALTLNPRVRTPQIQADKQALHSNRVPTFRTPQSQSSGYCAASIALVTSLLPSRLRK